VEAAETTSIGTVNNSAVLQRLLIKVATIVGTAA